MLAQRDLGLYTPPERVLATLRREIQGVLSRCPCPATRQRVLLAVNEVVANVLRHAVPQATDIEVDFVDHDGMCYCVVRDDGGAFKDFQAKWQHAAMTIPRGGLVSCRLGLCLVCRLWPEAFYVPRTDAYPLNSFILPLTPTGMSRLPPFFRSKLDIDWYRIVSPLAVRSGKGTHA